MDMLLFTCPFARSLFLFCSF